MDDRSSWDSLTAQVIPLIQQLTRAGGPKRRLTLVAESFGGCLAFRLALAVPDLIANMVVVNSATCFDKSYSGIVNLIAASNLLSLFPEQLYQVRPPYKHVNDVGPSTNVPCQHTCQCCFADDAAISDLVACKHGITVRLVYGWLTFSTCVQVVQHCPTSSCTSSQQRADDAPSLITICPTCCCVGTLRICG